MAQEEGLVAGIKDDGWAQVVTERRDACGDCGASHCCVSFGSGSKLVVKALNKAGAGVGDRVLISLSSVSVLKSAALFYIVPMIGLLSGATTGAAFSRNLPLSETGGAILFGFAGLLLGFVVTRLITGSMSKNNRLSPIITEIIRKEAVALESLMAIDPVCKMAVDPAEAPPSFVYRNRAYYFCHASCRESFIKEPERYL